VTPLGVMTDHIVGVFATPQAANRRSLELFANKLDSLVKNHRGVVDGSVAVHECTRWRFSNDHLTVNMLVEDDHTGSGGHHSIYTNAIEIQW